MRDASRELLTDSVSAMKLMAPLLSSFLRMRVYFSGSNAGYDMTTTTTPRRVITSSYSMQDGFSSGEEKYQGRAENKGAVC